MNEIVVHTATARN